MVEIDLSKIQEYFANIPHDELYSYMGIFIGIVLIVFAFILGG